METVEERPRIIEIPGRKTIKFGQTIYNDIIASRATQIIITIIFTKPNIL